MNLASPFSLAVLAIVALSLLGLPIGHAMIAGSVLYLWILWHLLRGDDPDAPDSTAVSSGL